jgi:hypothetical protein
VHVGELRAVYQPSCSARCIGAARDRLLTSRALHEASPRAPRRPPQPPRLPPRLNGQTRRRGVEGEGVEGEGVGGTSTHDPSAQFASQRGPSKRIQTRGSKWRDGGDRVLFEPPSALLHSSRPLRRRSFGGPSRPAFFIWLHFGLLPCLAVRGLRLLPGGLPSSAPSSALPSYASPVRPPGAPSPSLAWGLCRHLVPLCRYVVVPL